MLSIDNIVYPQIGENYTQSQGLGERLRKSALRAWGAAGARGAVGSPSTAARAMAPIIEERHIQRRAKPCGTVALGAARPHRAG